MMVSPRRYIKHHELKTEKIQELLHMFGKSGEVAGFWCDKGKYTKIFDCITCERYNYCPNTHPPLERIYDPDGGYIDKYRGDFALRVLMSAKSFDHKDWLYTQHPETMHQT